MSFSQRKKTSIIVMISLFLAMGLVAWFAILPIKRSITEKMDGIQKFYTSRENRDRQISKLPELEEQFNIIKADEEVLDILLEENHIVDFVRTLEDLARDTGTEIVITSKEGNAIVEKKAVKPQTKNTVDTGTDTPSAADKKKEPSILESLPFDRYLHLNVAVVGKYSDIVNFLHKMETLPFALDVVGIEVHLSENEENQASSRTPVSGGGINPFMVSPTDSKGVPVAEVPAVLPEKKNLLEAVFDTVVYIDKK